MSRKVKAIYEEGVFRPLEPLTLPERQQVEVTIPETAADEVLDTEYIERVKKMELPEVSLEEVRRALSGIPRKLSDDFIDEREERF
jgi:predicted DNA-binding antitoxin AbrB/MazE fold protein